MVCAVLIVLAGSAGFAQRWLRADALDCSCATGWTYPADSSVAVRTSADGHTQTTVAIRPDATQGFDLQLTNRAGVTETILGWGLRSGGKAVGPFGATSFAILFSVDGDASAGLSSSAVDQPAPASIRPGGFRTLRLTWSSASLPCVGPGITVSLNAISLRVRVGWLTRTEVIALPEAFALTGPSRTCPSGS